MSGHVYKQAVVDAVFFTAASFIVIYVAGFIHTFLEDTVSELDLGLTVIFTLIIILVMFSIAVYNLVSEHDSLKDRLLAVACFILMSGAMLWALAWLFLIPA